MAASHPGRSGSGEVSVVRTSSGPTESLPTYVALHQLITCELQSSEETLLFGRLESLRYGAAGLIQGDTAAGPGGFV